MNNFLQEGNTLTLAPAADVAAGTGCLFGAALFGVALTAAVSGIPSAFRTEGVVEIAKTTALAIGVGDRVFWDAANKCVNKTSAAQVCVGVCVEAVASGVKTVKVKLGAFLPAAT